MTATNTIQECIYALDHGFIVYAKNGMGDWIRVNFINSSGCAQVADDLSGFNSGIVGRWMTPNHTNADLRIRDFEIQ